MASQRTTPDPAESYTILRIKRKRNEEPLDALVVDNGPRKKRTKGGINVFQFAETVEDGAWDDELQKKSLEDRIVHLVRERPKSAPPTNESGDAVSVPLPPTPPPAQSPLRQQISQSRSYTVLAPKSPESPKQAIRRRVTSPPKILSKKEYDQQQRSFTLYEAVPSSTSLAAAASSGTDPEVEKFLPLLQEYLKFSDSSPPDNLATADSPSDDDYVWDVFYSRPAAHRELFNQLNVGMVSGLPQSASGYLDSDSDDDFDEEEDEDSNAEDFYKNDYPDEESDSDWNSFSDKGSDDSDAFHERSDHDSLFRNDDRDDDDLDWR